MVKNITVQDRYGLLKVNRTNKKQNNRNVTRIHR